MRIGFATAKGLAYALNIPLIKIDTLKALSKTVINSLNKNAYYCPLIDARRMEVYFAIHDSQLSEIHKANNLILTEESITLFNVEKDIYFFGDGLEKSKPLLSALQNAYFIDNRLPSASHMIELAYQKFIDSNFDDIAYAEPFYLKDFFFTTSTK